MPIWEIQLLKQQMCLNSKLTKIVMHKKKQLYLINILCTNIYLHNGERAYESDSNEQR